MTAILLRLWKALALWWDAREDQWVKQPIQVQGVLWVIFFVGVPMLINWPPWEAFTSPSWGVFLAESWPGLLVPFGYIGLIFASRAFTPSSTDQHAARPALPATGLTHESDRPSGPRELLGFLLGLCLGGAVWLQVLADIILVPTWMGACPEYTDTPRCLPKLVAGQWDKVSWEYLGGHIYDLFAAAAIVAVVGYFGYSSRHALTRSIWLAVALGVVGGATGLAQAAILNQHHVSVMAYGLPNSLLIVLWALTGMWFGVVAGLLRPDRIFSREKREVARE